MNQLRIELRTRNNVLWHGIFDQYESVADFCRLHDFGQSVIGGYLNLSESPYRHNSREIAFTKTALRLANTLGFSPNDLFPPTLYSGVIPRKLVAEVPGHEFVALQYVKSDQLALPPAQDQGVMRTETQAAVEQALSSLKPREASILRARFGFDGQDEQTLQSIADSYGITRERVRAIEAAALRKMRHPARSRKLRAHAQELR